MNVQASLWRSIAVFRVASLVYAAVLIVVDRADYKHLGWAWAVLAGMAAWTAFTSAAYAVPARRTRLLLAADLLVTAAALASTALLQYPGSVAKAAMPVTATWVAGPVLAWAVAGGIRAGVVAALVLGACDLTLRHQSLAGVYRSPALNGTVLLLLAGVAVGYVSTLADRAERAVQRATEIEAASRERDRLARGIHDSVLQVLALVQRRGAEVGGEAAEIGRLAGEQEAALRALIAADGDAAAPRWPPGTWTCGRCSPRKRPPRYRWSRPPGRFCCRRMRPGRWRPPSARRWTTCAATAAGRRAPGCWWTTRGKRSR